MKRILMGLAVVALIATFGFFFVAPASIDADQNTLDSNGEFKGGLTPFGPQVVARMDGGGDAGS